MNEERAARDSIAAVLTRLTALEAEVARLRDVVTLTDDEIDAVARLRADAVHSEESESTLGGSLPCAHEERHVARHFVSDGRSRAWVECEACGFARGVIMEASVPPHVVKSAADEAWRQAAVRSEPVSATSGREDEADKPPTRPSPTAEERADKAASRVGYDFALPEDVVESIREHVEAEILAHAHAATEEAERERDEAERERDEAERERDEAFDNWREARDEAADNWRWSDRHYKARVAAEIRADRLQAALDEALARAESATARADDPELDEADAPAPLTPEERAAKLVGVGVGRLAFQCRGPGERRGHYSWETSNAREMAEWIRAAIAHEIRADRERREAGLRRKVGAALWSAHTEGRLHSTRAQGDGMSREDNSRFSERVETLLARIFDGGTGGGGDE